MGIRRLLMIFIIILLLMANSLICTAYPNEQDSFRGLQWGTELSSINDSMNYLRTDDSYGGCDIYTRDNEDLTLGSAKLTNIEYSFWQGKLNGVFINVSGIENWYGLYNATVQKFGEGFKTNSYRESYLWDGKITVINAKYNEFLHKGFVYMYSKNIADEQETWERQKASEGAKSGF